MTCADTIPSTARPVFRGCAANSKRRPSAGRSIFFAATTAAGCKTPEELKSAKPLKYRWHDCRHTFVTRLAENTNVSEETIRALAGHVSKKMLERYSHIRSTAKQAAIFALDRTREQVLSQDERGDQENTVLSLN
jgi:integrase